MYVSTMPEPDLFQIEFLVPQIFQSKKDGLRLDEGHQIFGEVPRQTSSLKEFKQVQDIGNNTVIFLLFSLVVPIGVKLFLSIGIIFDIIWDLFNML